MTTASDGQGGVARYHAQVVVEPSGRHEPREVVLASDFDRVRRELEDMRLAYEETKRDQLEVIEDLKRMAEQRDDMVMDRDQSRDALVAYMRSVEDQEAACRDAGVDFTEVRKALSQCLSEDATFSLLVEVMRRTVTVLVEQETATPKADLEEAEMAASGAVDLMGLAERERDAARRESEEVKQRLSLAEGAPDMNGASISLCREMLKERGIPEAAFFDDCVRNCIILKERSEAERDDAIRQRDEAMGEVERLRGEALAIDSELRAMARHFERKP